MQYPGKSAPADLYGGEWTNISAQFAGQFFRCEGGNAATFGSTQDGGAPDITGSIGVNDDGYASGAFYTTAGARWNFANRGSAQINFVASRSNGIYTANEVRPYNTAIRIWEKTG